MCARLEKRKKAEGRGRVPPRGVGGRRAPICKCKKLVEEGIVIRTWVEPGFEPIIIIVIILIVVIAIIDIIMIIIVMILYL